MITLRARKMFEVVVKKHLQTAISKNCNRSYKFLWKHAVKLMVHKTINRHLSRLHLSSYQRFQHPSCSTCFPTRIYWLSHWAIVFIILITRTFVLLNFDINPFTRLLRQIFQNLFSLLRTQIFMKIWYHLIRREWIRGRACQRAAMPVTHPL